mgnify:CR=1 FL=1
MVKENTAAEVSLPQNLDALMKWFSVLFSGCRVTAVLLAGYASNSGVLSDIWPVPKNVINIYL